MTEKKSDKESINNKRLGNIEFANLKQFQDALVSYNKVRKKIRNYFCAINSFYFY